MLDYLHWRNNTAHRIWDTKEDKGATQQNQGLKSGKNLVHCVQFAEICYEQLCLCWGRCVHKIVIDYVRFVGCMFGGTVLLCNRRWYTPLHSQRLYSNVQIHVLQRCECRCWVTGCWWWDNLQASWGWGDESLKPRVPCSLVYVLREPASVLVI